MFSGRPRRTVNLGSKKQASAHDVLRNAELQRQKREKLRCEVAAARSVQSHWRAAQLLNCARKDLVGRLLATGSGTFAFNSADEFAWVLPVLPTLHDDERVRIVDSFLNSPASDEPSSLLIQRLPNLWKINDMHLHALGLRVLRKQKPTFIPLPVLTSLIGAKVDAETLAWLAWNDPKGFIDAASQLSMTSLIDDLPEDVLPAFDTVTDVPQSINRGSQALVHSMLRRLIPRMRDAWRFVFALIIAVDSRRIPHRRGYTHELCDRKTISQSLAESPVAVAQYIMALLHLYPQSKPSVLLNLSLASRPSPLTVFWQSFKVVTDLETQEVLLNAATELYSYWLLVATDAELVNNASLGLDSGDLWDFATTIRDRSFDLLWKYEPNRRVTVSAAVVSTLKLLRQLYTRDSRMRLFPPGFWLMEAIPQTQFVQLFENSSDVMDTNYDSDLEDEDEDEDGSQTRSGQPRLELNASPARRVLEHAPFFVAFETRVALFYRFIARDRDAQLPVYARQHFDVNRETLVGDAQLVFASLGSRVKTELQVRLLSDGTPEAGVDGGGLTRELLMLTCEEVFHKELQTSKQPCFVETINHNLAPNPVFGETPALMSSPIKAKFLFLGQVIGKCLYENLLVNVEFAPFFLSKWNKSSSNSYAIKSSFDDLSLLDEELYDNISKLHSLHGSEVADLGLDFTMLNSQRKVVELKPGGSQIPVNDSNKLEFMREVANYKLNTSLKAQTMWFLTGLSQIIRLEWLNMFNPQEVNKLISGESHDYDVDDLMEHIEIYGFVTDSPTIANLRKVLKEFKAEQRADFLKFVTSVPRAPLLGFSRLQPNFGIRFAGNDDQRLPTSSTCVNLLKLPEYSSLEILREKLLYSIESKAGFELS